MVAETNAGAEERQAKWAALENQASAAQAEAVNASQCAVGAGSAS
jgi:hypothetical protein